MSERSSKTEINLLYWFYTWILTVVCSPALVVLSDFNVHWLDIYTLFLMFLYLIALGLIFSLPTMLIYTLAFQVVLHFQVKKVPAKLILAFVGLTGIFSTFYLLFDFQNNELTLYYSTGLILSISAVKYDLKEVQKEEP